MVNLTDRPILVATDEASQTLLERLAPEQRAAVILALVGLCLLGVLLAVVTLLAGRWARLERPPRPTRAPLRARLARDQEPGNAPLSEEVSRSDTIVEKPDDDTIVK